MNWQQPYLNYFNSEFERYERQFAAMDPIDISQLGSITFDDLPPQRLLRLETLVHTCAEFFDRSDREQARRELRRRQLQERQAKKWQTYLRLKQRDMERARKKKKQEPPTLYQRMAAFIRSFVQKEKSQLPKDMYSVQSVQKERQQRSKPLKQSYVIRSKKPTDLH